jgi:hypothetical protein
LKLKFDLQVSKFAFKWVNVSDHYAVGALDGVASPLMKWGKLVAAAVGLYKLNAVDPQLESAWFQPLSL